MPKYREIASVLRWWSGLRKCASPPQPLKKCLRQEQRAVLRTAVLYPLHDKATGAIAKAAAPVLYSIRGFGSCPGYSF